MRRIILGLINLRGFSCFVLFLDNHDLATVNQIAENLFDPRLVAGALDIKPKHFGHKITNPSIRLRTLPAAETICPACPSAPRQCAP